MGWKTVMKRRKRYLNFVRSVTLLHQNTYMLLVPQNSGLLRKNQRQTRE